MGAVLVAEKTTVTGHAGKKNNGTWTGLGMIWMQAMTNTRTLSHKSQKST